MWKRIRNWWQAEGALVGLQGVSDRMLEDMGLDREELRARVMGEAAPTADAACGCLPAGRLAQG